MACETELTTTLTELFERYNSGQIGFHHTLSEISEHVYEHFGINLWFVEILGRRWSYIAGRTSPSFSPPEHIQLNEQYGLLADEWQELPEDQREHLVNWLKRIVEAGT